MNNLAVGDFTNVASALVKSKTDIFCTICYLTFAEDDKVTELECDERHIFHIQCLKPWLEKSLSCPLCREAINAD